MAYRHYEDLWFEDRNVILEAGGVVFRLYRGILARNSPIWADLFAVPQPLADAESYDECPIVHLHDDVDDLRYFLHAINDVSFYRSDIATPYPVVAGILRLASKYAVSFLRERCIAHLSLSYPSSLSDWKVRERQQDRAVTDIPAHAIVNLAREVNALSLLPTALYCYCAATSLEDIVNGQMLADGTVATVNDRDRRSCILGRVNLGHRQRLQMLGALSTCPDGWPGCSTPSHCQPGQWRMLARLWSLPEEEGLSCRVLIDIGSVKEAKSATGWCDKCCRYWISRMLDAQTRIWADLPSIFDLPPWDVLLASQE
ncbi:hypothetical protein PUNSTDRAFT_144161 [Punctularia strigosozonata HHB-11173 SS5]|uniref:uncharacterized protein n=1 Tax=Punctularia strigosozonata (strain HHB-11173) TaxID=741275 RepID=UPI0004416DBF|nr:uncharacterized protein PUNSTDRAFT_144161 [Punctularia strigosozonata HHB-11173 SS5]EIN08683.1 hypothetical protein PUNSTDRAFT_144161 [Punctularia strigosozonata HHB-11173 SS5]